MRIVFLISIILSCYQLSTYSQEFHISATVVDYMTGEMLDSVTMLVLTPDSTITHTFQSKKHGKWNFNIKINNPGTYILCFSRQDYDDIYLTRTFNYIKYRKTSEDIGRVFMKKRYAFNLSLNEIVVKPTQIKMFHKGDTVVYNADAFNLPEGSMLNELVQMLPGAQIDTDGQIFVNGKKISSLMLNGNDFFKGNPKVALDNLPAYTVKDIKVYEHQSDKELALGLQKIGSDYPLVMDVNLKKQYSIGWMGNAEGGFGTNSHYVGRTFLMRFTKQSRVALYADANDINEEYTYRSDGQWNDNQSNDGILKTLKGGLDIVINDKHQQFKLEGNAIGSILNNNREEYSSTTEFYSIGNIHKKSTQAFNDKKTELNVNLNYSCTPQRGIYIRLTPFFNYQRYKNSSGLLSADLNRTIKEKYRGEMLDSIFSPIGMSDVFRSLTLSTLENNMMGEGYNLVTGFNSELSMKPNSTSDIITVMANLRYENSEKNQVYDYNQFSEMQQTVHQYNFKRNPINKYDYSIKGSYKYYLENFLSEGRTAIDLSYIYVQNYVSNSSPFYKLGDTKFVDTDFYRLQSMPDKLSMFMDAANTYQSSSMQRKHRPELSISGSHWGEKSLSYNIGFPFILSDEELNYKRSILDTIATHHEFYFEPYFILKYQTKVERLVKGFEIKYQLSQSMPNLVQTLDYRDESSPLVIRLGNADLKKSSHHYSYLRLYKENGEQLELISLSLYHNLMQNLLCQSITYDLKSGTRTYKPQNINGNWNAGITLDYQFPSETSKRRLTTKTEAQYSNNVDFASTNSKNTIRNSVRNTTFSERVEYMFYKGNYLPIFNIDVNVMYTHSESKLFDVMNLCDMKCGIRGRIPLPWNMEMEQRLDTYIHRGYQDKNFNTEKFIWSAYIQKRFLKGNMTVRLETFDILNQMGNIQHVLTSQMQSETYHNSIKQYFILKLRYNFIKQPKK